MAIICFNTLKTVEDESLVKLEKEFQSLSQIVHKIDMEEKIAGINSENKKLLTQEINDIKYCLEMAKLKWRMTGVKLEIYIPNPATKDEWIDVETIHSLQHPWVYSRVTNMFEEVAQEKLRHAQMIITAYNLMEKGKKI